MCGIPQNETMWLIYMYLILSYFNILCWWTIDLHIWSIHVAVSKLKIVVLDGIVNVLFLNWNLRIYMTQVQILCKEKLSKWPVSVRKAKHVLILHVINSTTDGMSFPICTCTINYIHTVIQILPQNYIEIKITNLFLKWLSHPHPHRWGL